jgi:aminomuconate-semialdehyde/2-hydroxymuconate-6-semialdehyde dehydrogenase
VCLCSERIYVHRSIFDRFVTALAAGARALTLGDPRAASTTTGPLISHEHAQKVLSYYELARAEGAVTILGGGAPDLAAPFSSGSWVQPTIWTGLQESARVVREEVFGPCCHVAPFDDEDEAVRMANDTPYGLCAAIWTQDVSRAHRVARRMDVGLVWVNTWYLRDLRTAFGGTKLSGVGREGGRHSFDFYSETKNVCVKLYGAAPPSPPLREAERGPGGEASWLSRSARHPRRDRRRRSPGRARPHAIAHAGTSLATRWASCVRASTR